MNIWYHKDYEEVFDQLSTSTDGLSAEEVQQRLSKYGYNKITEEKKTGPFIRFLLQFNNLLIYILMVAAGIVAFLHEWIDAGVIFGVVIINAVIGFVQESKAEEALASLKKMLSLQTTVIRAGNQLVIPAEGLVPGDVVVLTTGDRVPADLRLFKTRNLHLDEAALTGESLSVHKRIEAITEEVETGDMINMAFEGTFVTSGQGMGVVTATGDNTELGKIAGMLQQVEKVKTPLEKKLAAFGKTLTFYIIVVCIAVYVFGTLQQDLPAMEMFMAAVAIAISAIPEGLPAIMTITLAIGVTRMAGRNAIIRKLPVVETLGSVGIICTDKTGTLTRNEMTVKRIFTAEGDFIVTGVGYTPTGSFIRDENRIEVTDSPELVELLKAGLLCNDARLVHDGVEWSIKGEPTEGALIVAAQKAHLVHKDEMAAMPRDDEIPFESEQQYMASLHHDHHGNGIIYIKGSPELIISLSDAVRGKADEAIDRAYWEECARDMASDGLRVLAIACKPVSQAHKILEFSDIEQGGFSLLGLTGMLDPLRKDAVDAVKDCREAGIRVKMITGDHAQTARALATEIGLGSDVHTGLELDQFDDEAFDKVSAEVNVFARVTPSHKLRLVRSLQKQGEIIAMTGDGVNDAPALKQADIGIAMGITGTEVSKEASDMIITDDNFASIKQAMEEGRTVYNNLKKTIMFILPTNGGECLVIIWAILIGSLLPVLPLHILWINMITTVALAITLAFEPVEPGTMRIPPRDPDTPLMEIYLVWRIVLVAIMMAAGTFGLFLYESGLGASLEEARTVAVNTIVFFEIFYIFNTRFLTASVLSIKGLLGNRIILIGVSTVIVFQLMFTYWSVLNHLFGTEAIGPGSWIRIIVVSVCLFLIVELEKAIMQRKAPAGI